MNINIKGKRKSQSPKIGTFSLSMMAITSIVGFGWLFGSYNAVKMAGPASVISWMIGGFAVMLIALTLVELGTMFPKTGGIVHYLNISHGPLAGVISSWVNWFVLSAVVTLEAYATMQCLASWNFHLLKGFYSVNSGTLTGTGVIAAGILILIYFLINYWALSILVVSVNVLGLLKLCIPVLIAVILIIAGFTSHCSQPVTSEFMPNGWSSVLSAIPLCGIFFCYYGFHSVLSLSEEIKDPAESIPFAIIGSLFFCIVLYLLLQIAFIIALPANDILQNWDGLSFINTPYMKLAVVMNLNIALILLNIETFISPNGNGIVSAAASSRMIKGMANNGHMPNLFGRIHPKSGIPRIAICLNFVVCLMLLLIFKEWKNILGVLSIACIISYMAGPVAAGTLRRVAPDYPRTFKFPFMGIVSPLTFIFCSLALYWAKWELLGQAIIVILAVLFFYTIIKYYRDIALFYQHLKSSLWLICYLVVMMIISYIGGVEFGGKGYLPSVYDQLIVAVTGLVFYYWAIYSGSYNESRFKALEKNY